MCEKLEPEKTELKDPEPELECNNKFNRASLSDFEKRKLSILINKIAQTVKLRQLVLRPFFLDYELIANNSGCVTFAHFFRVLSFLGIHIQPEEELKLLIKAYIHDSYLLNYVAFVEDIETNVQYCDTQRLIKKSPDLYKNYPGYWISVDLPKLARPEIDTVNIAETLQRETTHHPVVKESRHPMSFYDTMNRIKKHLLEHPVKLSQFFEGFDRFKTGLITAGQFIRGLEALGVSGLCKLQLIPQEIEEVTQIYQSSKDPSKVEWVKFIEDVNCIYGENNLHKNPTKTVNVPPEEIQFLPKMGTHNWDCVFKDWKELCQDTVYKIRAIVTKRKLEIEPIFQDFDKLRTGHVTKAQSRRGLTTIGILLSDKEIQALEKRYTDDFGFNYQKFLNEVLPQEQIICMYEEFSKRKRLINARTPGENEIARDVVQILADVKAQAVVKRVSIPQFMEGFDSLNHQKITREEFIKGLETASIIIPRIDAEVICQTFKSTTEPDKVDYRRFCNLIEEVFSQKPLEKAPLLLSLQHIPIEEGDHSFLNFEERTIVSLALQKLARQVQPNLQELFEDFDKEKVGRVTLCQFQRILTQRNLHTLLSSREIYLVFKCFSIKRSLRLEMKYREFLNALILVANAKVQLPN